MEVFKETSEDWYPNFFEKYVSVVFKDFTKQAHYPYESKFLVCVWGNDDCGMERWFSADQEQQALNTFMQIIGQNTVNRKHLKSLGLEPS